MALSGEAKKAWRKKNAARERERTKAWLKTPKGQAYLVRKQAADRAAYKAKAKPRTKRTKKPTTTKRKQEKAWRNSIRLLGIATLGGRCAMCGNNDERVLEFDHIKPLLRRSTGNHNHRDNIRPLRRLIKDPTAAHGLQLLCANCHRIKTRQGNEWAMRFDLDRQEPEPMGDIGDQMEFEL